MRENWVLQAYTIEGDKLVPVSGGSAALAGALWIDVCEPTPEEQNAVEQALHIELHVPAEPARFQVSSPLRTSAGYLTLTALLLAGLDEHRPRLVTVSFIRSKGPLVTVTKGASGGLGWLARNCGDSVPAASTDAFPVLLDMIIEHTTDVLDRVGGDLDGSIARCSSITSGASSGRGCRPRRGGAIASSSGFSRSSAIAARCW